MPAWVEGELVIPEAPLVPMSLEQRMALRQEMMSKIVQVTLAAAGLPPSASRFKIVPTDKRGHRYAALVDVPQKFVESPEGSRKELTRLAQVMKDAATERFSLIVTGVYWRPSESLALPETSLRI